ncbi:MAG: ATP-binding protein, partial [Pseudomonadota bacterium]
MKRFKDYVPLPFILLLALFGTARVVADFLHDLDYVSSIQGEVLQFLAAFLFSCVSLTVIFRIISARDIRIGFFICTALVLMRHVLEIIDEFESPWIAQYKDAFNFVGHTISVVAFFAVFGVMIVAFIRLSRTLDDLRVETEQHSKDITLRESAVTQKERAERNLEILAHTIASVSGSQLFETIVRNIAETLNVRGALISERKADHRLEILAFWDGEQWERGIGSSIASGTPCGSILSEGSLYVPRNAGDTFDVLSELVSAFPVEACCGVALTVDEERVGTLLLLHDKPIPNDLTQHPALMIVAARAATEIRQRRDLAFNAQLEAQIREKQRLESLGVLAGGVAHDFNNLLTVILGNADLARHRPSNNEADETLSRQMSAIVEAAERAASLTRTMLDYVGGMPPDLRPIDLCELVTNTVTFLQATTTRKVSLVTDIPPSAFILGDEGQLSQVLINLVNNAVEAIEGQGTVTVRVSSTKVDQEEAEQLQPYSMEPGQVYSLSVIDDGPGMNPATMQKIFDPFFTTKETGRGLGLATVLGITRSHKGALKVESAPGSGTSINILIHQTDPSVHTLTRETERTLRHDGIIMIVDDEREILSLMSEILNRRGFETVA